MEQKNDKKPLVQRVVEANILGDGNLYSITSTEVLAKSFDAYSTDENDANETEEEKE
ncbi:MAG: hypothetical protein AB7G87_05255 [Clostridia bacterium]